MCPRQCRVKIAEHILHADMPALSFNLGHGVPNHRGGPIKANAAGSNVAAVSFQNNASTQIRRLNIACPSGNLDVVVHRHADEEFDPELCLLLSSSCSRMLLRNFSRDGHARWIARGIQRVILQEFRGKGFAGIGLDVYRVVDGARRSRRLPLNIYRAQVRRHVQGQTF